LQASTRDETDWNLRIRINSVAAWLEECCQFDPHSKSVIGRNKDELDPVTLYGSYGAFCRGAGFQPRSLNNFSQDVIDTAKTFFSIELIKTRTNTTRLLSGVRLVAIGDKPVTTSDNLVTTSDNLSDNLKPLCSKDSDNRDNLLAKDSSKEVLPESQLSDSKDSIESLENNFLEEVVTVVTENPQTLASNGIEASDNLGDRLSLSCHQPSPGCHQSDSPAEKVDEWITLHGGSRQVKILRRDEYRSLVQFRDDGSQKMIYNYLIDE
jgi:putative DNA primase/helicase